MKKPKKVVAHITRCICGRINICDDDWQKHKGNCKCGGEIVEDRGDSAELKKQAGILILATERGYCLV